MDAPPLFRCPISMQLMENPVTIATGMTYERRSIERWLFEYKKTTCPATMQRLESFDLTPNHTLKRLIASWLNDRQAQSSPPPASPPCMASDNLMSLLSTIESSPFKVSSLKKLTEAIDAGDEVQNHFIACNGLEVLARVMVQVGAVESTDFTAFRACEEAIGVLHSLPLADESSVQVLSKPECMKPMILVLQRGNADARLHAMAVLQRMSKIKRDWSHITRSHDAMDVFKSLLELLSDEISAKLSSASLELLIEIVSSSKKNRIKAVEAGAVCVLIELLPDANRRKCERILLLLKKLCECPEGRSAFADHDAGVAVVSKQILRVSELGTKLGVKILWVVSNSIPKVKVVEDMMVFGAVEKLLGLLHIEGRSSTKEKAIKIIRLHRGIWRHYPCFPCELRNIM